MFDLTHASVVALRLREDYARGNEKKHLKKLPEADADLLWKCLLRAGWWFPEFWKPDYATGKERLAWWLDQGDFARSKELSDDPKVDEFKINHLTDAHAKILLLRKMAESPLTELSALRVLQSIVGASRNIDWLKAPLWFSWRIGDWPEDQSGDWHDEFCIRFDAEILWQTFEKSSNALDHWNDDLREWDILEPTDLNSAIYVLNGTKQYVKLWLNKLQRQWTQFCFFSEELVDGWEPITVDDFLQFPGQPIRDIDGLREWIKEWLRRVNTINRGAKISKNSMLSCVQRELRNSRRSLRAWNVPIPVGFNDRPADFFEAERQLELLIDSLRPPAVLTMEAKRTEAAAEQVPVLDEKQYLILEWMLREDRTSPDNRTNNKEISRGVDGKNASEQAFKEPLSKLVHLKLTDSKTGRGGGCWLTAEGIEIAKKLLANREVSKKP